MLLLLQASAYSPALDPQSPADRFASACIDGKVRFAPGQVKKIDRKSLPTFLEVMFDWNGESTVYQITDAKQGYLINIIYDENAKDGVLQTCAVASQFLNLRESGERLRYLITGMRFNTGTARSGDLRWVGLLDKKKMFELSLISLQYGYELAAIDRLTPKGLELLLNPKGKRRAEAPTAPKSEEIIKK